MISWILTFITAFLVGRVAWKMLYAFSGHRNGVYKGPLYGFYVFVFFTLGILAFWAVIYGIILYGDYVLAPYR